jgi:hypothetical protein
MSNMSDTHPSLPFLGYLDPAWLDLPTSNSVLDKNTEHGGSAYRPPTLSAEIKQFLSFWDQKGAFGPEGFWGDREDPSILWHEISATIHCQNVK